MSGGTVAQSTSTLAPVLEAWAWPVAALLAVLAVLAWVTFSTAARPVLGILFGRVRRISAFGVEFDLSQAAAIRTRTNVEAGFDELRSKLKRQFDALIDSEGLNNKLLDIAENVVRPHLMPKAARTYRCTIHIHDVLFEDALYQLLDYYPSGGGRGRTRSVRFGIIGRCARLNQPDMQADVTTNAEKLVEAWAMTTAEAAVVGSDRRSFAAIPLFDEYRQFLGIFYVDAVPHNAWRPRLGGEFDGHPLCDSIQDYANQNGLIAALSRIMSEMRKTGPRLRLIK